MRLGDEDRIEVDDRWQRLVFWTEHRAGFFANQSGLFRRKSTRTPNQFLALSDQRLFCRRQQFVTPQAPDRVAKVDRVCIVGGQSNHPTTALLDGIPEQSRKSAAVGVAGIEDREALGAEYAHLSFGIERPRVGLLNVGTEPSKGPEALRDAAALLEAAASERFAFVGFVEGSDICKDTAVVFVTDGFTGNVALKTAEGTASFIGEALREAFRNSFWSQIAALFAATSLRRMRERIDPRRMNGGVFLGLNGGVVKSHGSADGIGFASAIELAAKMAETDFPRLVAAQLAKLDTRGKTAVEGAPRGAGE